MRLRDKRSSITDLPRTTVFTLIQDLREEREDIAARREMDAARKKKPTKKKES